MNSNRKIPDLKGRDFNSIQYTKIKRLRQELRHKIRQLLRSFIPLDERVSEAQTGQENQP